MDDILTAIGCLIQQTRGLTIDGRVCTVRGAERRLLAGCLTRPCTGRSTKNIAYTAQHGHTSVEVPWRAWVECWSSRHWPLSP